MKQWIMITMILVVLSGCRPAQQAEQGYYERLAEAVNTSVDLQQKSTHQIIEALEQSHTLSTDKLAKIEKKITHNKAKPNLAPATLAVVTVPGPIKAAVTRRPGPKLFSLFNIDFALPL